MNTLKQGLLVFLNRTGLARSVSLLRRGIGHPSLFAREWKNRRRFRRFRARYGHFLSQRGPVPSNGKKVLVICLFSEPYLVEYLCGLMKSLQLRGYEPVMLANSYNESYPYFKLFGFNDVLFFNEFLHAAQAHPAAKALKPLKEFKTIGELKEYVYGGARVGMHVLSTVSRTLRQGDLSLSNPDVRREFEQMWPRVQPTVEAAAAVLDRVRPHTTVFLEIGYFTYGEFFDLSLERGLNTVEYTGSHRIQFLSMKRYTKESRHLHPQSISPETWERVKKMEFTPQREKELFEEIEKHYESGGWTNEERLQYGKKIIEKDRVIRELGLDPSKKTAVIFSHILWDATFFFGTDLFENYAEWLVATVKAAVANPRLNWIIKLHPANAWKMRADGAGAQKFNEVELLNERIGKLPPHIKFIDSFTQINTFSLFDITDYCLTVRGTIAIEMTCYGIPAIVAGTGRYAGFGFTNESATRGEYLDKLARLETIGRLSKEETLLARKHAYALFLLRPLDVRTIQYRLHTDQQFGSLTERDTMINADSIDDLMAATDLKEFADWAMESKEPDYLAN